MTGPIYAVVDTNVLVSGVISPNGPPGKIADLLREGEVRFVLDDRILREYRTVLMRPMFGFSAREVEIFLETLARSAVYAEVKIAHCITSMPNPGDIPFAECALAFRCPIVTGNVKHYKVPALKTLKIFAPRAFLDYLA